MTTEVTNVLFLAAADAHAAITSGDGTYCFAIDSASTDVVNYNSRESRGQKPQFIVGVAP